MRPAAVKSAPRVGAAPTFLVRLHNRHSLTTYCVVRTIAARAETAVAVKCRRGLKSNPDDAVALDHDAIDAGGDRSLIGAVRTVRRGAANIADGNFAGTSGTIWAWR